MAKILLGGVFVGKKDHCFYVYALASFWLNYRPPFSLQVLQSYGGYAESNLVDRAVKMRSQTLAAEEHYRGNPGP